MAKGACRRKPKAWTGGIARRKRTIDREAPVNSLNRRFLLKLVPAAALASSLPATLLAQQEKEQFEVTPAEDLMREHGLLKRILLIYDEVANRVAAKKDFPPSAVMVSAKIIRGFIEEYHEKLEEDHLFPRFRKHGVLVDLVNVLEQQHKAGRNVTDRIISLVAAGMKSAAEKEKLASDLRQFVRMYAPHEAREDTVLFPALHTIISRNEYDALGEDFEKREHQLFGKEGFEGMVPRVAEIEKQLGIYELSQFTPK
jgi:hemerythrin-like domain-containing protein